jgi:hypothetical protein
LVEVLLRFDWNGGKAIPGRRNTGGLTLAAAAPRRRSEGEQDAEQVLGRLQTQAGVARPRISSMAAAPGPQAPSQPMKLKVQLYRRPPKTSARAPSLLGESLKSPVECGGRGSASPCPADTAKKKRDIELWKRICAGLKGNYSDQRIAQNCARIQAMP